MNKRGQFYILAAVIIIGIIMGLGVAVNTARTNAKPSKFYDMSDEFGKEAYKVIDYSIANQENIKETITNFTEVYVPYLKESDPDAEVTFIYGNYDEVQVVSYTEAIGNIRLGTGEKSMESGGAFEMNIPVLKPSKKSIIPVDKKVRVSLAGNDYEFNLNEGQNFLFVLKKCKGEECYVSKS